MALSKIMRRSYLTIYQNLLETVKITESFREGNSYVIEYRVISYLSLSVLKDNFVRSKISQNTVTELL